MSFDSHKIKSNRFKYWWVHTAIDRWIAATLESGGGPYTGRQSLHGDASFQYEGCFDVDIAWFSSLWANLWSDNERLQRLPCMRTNDKITEVNNTPEKCVLQLPSKVSPTRSLLPWSGRSIWQWSQWQNWRGTTNWKPNNSTWLWIRGVPWQWRHGEGQWIPSQGARCEESISLIPVTILEG